MNKGELVLLGGVILLAAWQISVWTIRAARWVYSGFQARRASDRIANSAYERVQARKKRTARSEYRSGMKP